MTKIPYMVYINKNFSLNRLPTRIYTIYGITVTIYGIDRVLKPLLQADLGNSPLIYWGMGGKTSNLLYARTTIPRQSAAPIILSIFK